ncbi:MAG TPA: dihydropteroate synthase [Acidimicrobiia bacterium]|nr:dihydropteroate synthase [Acidimicrobiia bacterium]
MSLALIPHKPDLQLGPHLLTFADHTWVMAVINLSPESRNPQSVASGVREAVTMARRYREMGAGLIDLGGQSSHYESPTLESEVELARLLPAVTALVDDGFVVSVDTWKPDVARAALDAGAHLINDTGGLTHPEMRNVIREFQAAAVVVYVEGDNPHQVAGIDTAEGKPARTALALEGRLKALAAEGIERVVVDPGIALNYRSDYEAYTRLQLEVIRSSAAFHRLGKPLLLPIPRKREDHRVAAYISLALEHGADLIRVHDVAMACDLVELFGRGAPGPGT